MGPCICAVARPRNARRRLAMKRGTMACLACSSYSWMSTASYIPTTFSKTSPSFHRRGCRQRRAHPRPTTSGQLFANQFIELHLRHTLAHPPDNVLFPFLHGLEGDNYAQSTLFASSAFASATATHFRFASNHLHPNARITPTFPCRTPARFSFPHIHHWPSLGSCSLASAHHRHDDQHGRPLGVADAIEDIQSSSKLQKNYILF